MKKNNQNKKSVLIVEDERDLCFLLELMLAKDDIHADHVKSLAETRDFLQAEKVDLVLLDNRLPDGLGLDFISFIKRHHPESKVLMISGKDQSAHDIALENGADGFLAKPFTKSQLEESVRGLLNN